MFKTIAILAATMTAALASNSYELATHGSFDESAGSVDMTCACDDGSSPPLMTCPCPATVMTPVVMDPCELDTMTDDDKKTCRKAESGMPTTVKAAIVKAASEAGMTMAAMKDAHMDPCELKTLSEANKQACHDAIKGHHGSVTTLLQTNLRKNGLELMGCNTRTCWSCFWTCPYRCNGC